jgi:hypothetical protein
MNIPMKIQPKSDHPSLNENIYKGNDYQQHAALLSLLHKIVHDPDSNIMERIENIHNKLCNFEHKIIERTKVNITREDQNRGKLINRLPSDAQFINEISAQFDVIQDVCHRAKLARSVHVISAAAQRSRKKSITTEKLMPGIASVPITIQIDDAYKRAKNMHQRMQILSRAVNNLSKAQTGHRNYQYAKKSIDKTLKKVRMLQQPNKTSLDKVCSIYHEIAEDRLAHIQAIEHARNKKIYDQACEYQTYVLEIQGKEEHDTYIHSAKQEIYGREHPQPIDTVRLSGISQLAYRNKEMQQQYQNLNPADEIIYSSSTIKSLRTFSQKAK